MIPSLRIIMKKFYIYAQNYKVDDIVQQNTEIINNHICSYSQLSCKSIQYSGLHFCDFRIPDIIVS